MRIRTTTQLFLLAICIGVMGTGFRPITTAITATVTFGNPQSNGGPCVGKGVCKAALSGDNGVNVTFSVAPHDPNTLIMSFSMGELRSKQPEQLSSFLDPSKTYRFDSPYTLSESLYGPLELMSNPQILPSSPSRVEIMGDVVSVYYIYSHN